MWIKINEESTLSYIHNEYNKLLEGTQIIKLKIEENNYNVNFIINNKITITKNYIQRLQENNILIYID